MILGINVEDKKKITTNLLIKKTWEKFMETEVDKTSVSPILGASPEKKKLMPNIFRTAQGKPFFHESNIKFSISHSGGVFCCLMGESNLGIDIQKHKNTDIYKIARRFYTIQEQDYVRNYGSTGFWKIWTMKEAYVKYQGGTLAEYLTQFSMVRNGQLLKELSGIKIEFIPTKALKEIIYTEDFQIDFDDFTCVYMGEVVEPIKIVKMWE